MKLRPHMFGQWAPDQPATGGGGRLTIAKNVIPYKRHYAPQKKLIELGDAIDGRPLGAVAVRDAAAAVHIFAGDETKLYEQATDGAWTDRSKSGGYTATAATRWRFWPYGDRLLATNGQDPIQYRDMTAGSDFDDLPGAPQLCQFGCSFGQFVIIGNLDDSASKIRWCSIGDSEAWSGNQAGSENFTEGGQVTGFAVLDAPYIFQETLIRRAVYVGPPQVFAFDVIEKERGCIAPGSLCQLGRMIFFRAEDGFYAFNGENSIPIGVDEENASLYDQWFIDNAQRDFFFRMSSAIDPRTKTARWLFASTSSTTGRPDMMLTYNWSAGRAAFAPVDAELLTPMLTPSLTLEDLDDLYDSIDDIPFSLDDPILAGGVPQLGGMSEGGRIVRFSGGNAEARFTTDDFLDAGGLGVYEVQAIAPLIDAENVGVRVGYRFRFNDALSWSGETQMNAIGVCPARVQGRFLRVDVRVPEDAAWSKAEGFGFFAIRRGQR